jgi:hypothetical protein
MAVTAPKKVKPHDGEMLEVVEVTRGYLDEHPSGERTWQSLLEACMTDSRVEFRRIEFGDLSCSQAWGYRSDDPRAANQNKAWFRQGKDGQALLYQQGWRVWLKDGE